MANGRETVQEYRGSKTKIFICILLNIFESFVLLIMGIHNGPSTGSKFLRGASLGQLWQLWYTCTQIPRRNMGEPGIPIFSVISSFDILNTEMKTYIG